MTLFRKAGKHSTYEEMKLKYIPIYLSFAAIFISLLMLTVSTYAWFTDTQLTTGSKVNSGNMYIELLADGDYLDEIEYSGDRENFSVYTRKLAVSEEAEDYYIITGSDVPIITLENVEPGQIYPVSINAVNTGELALKYSAAFEIQSDAEGNSLSLTGLETLEREYTEHHITEEEYIFLKKLLEKDQLSSEEEDIGGHLEDVLKVYIGDDESDVVPEKCAGTLQEVMNGEISAYTGYLLPRDEVTDEEGNIVPKTVNVIGDDRTVIRTHEDASEIGKIDYLIVLPADTDNKYQYASITFSLGVHATQVEYETDGTNSMIYDSFGWVEE